MTRRAMVVSFTDDDRGLAVMCVVAFNARPATRATRDEPGEDAAIEAFSILTVESIEVMAGGLQLLVAFTCAEEQQLRQWVTDNYLSEIETEIRLELGMPDVNSFER